LIEFLINDVSAQIKYLVEFFCIFYQLKIKQILLLVQVEIIHSIVFNEHIGMPKVIKLFKTLVY